MIRFAVIGTNWITDRFLEAAHEVVDFKLEAVYSRTEDRAKAFALKHGVTRLFTNLNDLSKCNEIDAVYIASPNSFHAEQAIQLMKQGKHVLCEKPLASNTREVLAMIQAAEHNQVLLMEALYSTCLPNFKVIQQHLHRLGPIRRYVANFCKVSSRYDSYKEGTVLNAFNREFSSGSLMDLGIYGVLPMVALFGAPKAIKANGVLLETGVDGEGSVIASYDGMEAVILHSKISDSHVPSEIQGEEGTLIIDKISSPEKLEIRWRNGSKESIHVNQEHPPMYYEVQEFIECIKRGHTESVINSYEVSRITASILEEVRNQIGLIYPADHYKK